MNTSYARLVSCIFSLALTVAANAADYLITPPISVIGGSADRLTCSATNDSSETQGIPVTFHDATGAGISVDCFSVKKGEVCSATFKPSAIGTGQKPFYCTIGAAPGPIDEIIGSACFKHATAGPAVIGCVAAIPK
jgi:hypothetical protein